MPPAPRRHRIAATALVTLLPLTGCDAGSDGDAGTTTRPTSEPSASGTEAGAQAGERPPQERRDRGVLGALPDRPDPSRPAQLAHQLTRAERALSSPDAEDADLRRAGRFTQLASRALALASEGRRQAVLDRLRGPSLLATRRNTRAAQRLLALTSPQPRLPDWRVVAPPPPQVLLGHYRRAERRTGVAWEHLAAIHLTETRMGRIRGVSSAGAQGPMQFLPTTWDIYGGDGDIQDPRDAILAAGRLLRANGAPGDMDRALDAYNPSEDYVAAVQDYAAVMRSRPEAYRGYWHWRVLYRHERGTYVLPQGYPRTEATLLP